MKTFTVIMVGTRFADNKLILRVYVFTTADELSAVDAAYNIAGDDARMHSWIVKKVIEHTRGVSVWETDIE